MLRPTPLVGPVAARSVICVPLGESGLTQSVLSVYSEESVSWPSDVIDRRPVAADFSAAQLAISVLTEQRKVGNLRAAVQSKRSIGAAIGGIMNSQRCTYEKAFAQMVNHSQKLHSVADQVLQTGNCRICH